MGVSTHLYTYYGVKIDWNDDLHEAYELVEEKIHILLDCMGGDYIIMGVCLFNGGDARYGYEDSEDMVEVDPLDLDKLGTEYKKTFSEHLPKFSYLLDAPFKIISLLHFS